MKTLMIQKPYFSSTAIQTTHFLRPLMVVTGLLGVLCLGLYIILLSPAQSELAEVTATYHTVRDGYQRHQASRKLQEELLSIWDQLPAKRDFTGMGVTIAKLAKDNQVGIPGMGYSMEPLENGIASKGALAFDAAGGYEAIRRFIYKIETSRPHLFIEKLTAQRTKNSNEVAFKITLGTFFKPTSSNP